MPTLLISAGDASGDMHAADFVRAFRARQPRARFVGLGGAEMKRAGVEILADQDALAVGGLLELGTSLPRLVGAWRRLVAGLDSTHPDLVVLVDSGGFNLPFARHVRRRCAARILYYVAPQVWAWRRGRIRKLARRVDRMAVILPFEPAVYAGSSLPVDFVGNPLVDRLARVVAEVDRSEARRRLGLDPRAKLLVLLPGSRRNELSRQLPLQLEAIRLLHAREPALAYALAVAPSLSAEVPARLVRRAGLPASLRLDLIEGRTHELIRAADVALAKPGTVSTESMLLGRPMVVMGRANPLTAAVLRRALQVPWLAMPNLIAEREIVPELLQERARPEAIAAAVAGLLSGPARERQLADLAEASRRLGPGGAAEAASRIAEEMIGSRPGA